PHAGKYGRAPISAGRRREASGSTPRGARWGNCGRPPRRRVRPDRRRAAWGEALAGPALAADLLVELDAVAALGGVAALLPPDPPDLAEELGAVPLLRRQAALAAGLGSRHPAAIDRALRHAITSTVLLTGNEGLSATFPRCSA